MVLENLFKVGPEQPRRSSGTAAIARKIFLTVCHSVKGQKKKKKKKKRFRSCSHLYVLSRGFRNLCYCGPLAHLAS